MYIKDLSSWGNSIIRGYFLTAYTQMISSLDIINVYKNTKDNYIKQN